MNTIRSILLNLLLFFLISCSGKDNRKVWIDPKKHKYGKQILWNENRKLKWKDFNGKVPWQTTHAAATFGWIYSNYNYKKDTIEIEVCTYFCVDSSWVDYKDSTEYILNHEQKHFDLKEAYARKFRKYLYDWKGDVTFEEYLKSLYSDSILSDYQIQHRYDSETNHSLNHLKQKEWDIRIDSLLNVYKKYDFNLFDLY